MELIQQGRDLLMHRSAIGIQLDAFSEQGVGDFVRATSARQQLFNDQASCDVEKVCIPGNGIEQDRLAVEPLNFDIRGVGESPAQLTRLAGWSRHHIVRLVVFPGTSEVQHEVDTG